MGSNQGNPTQSLARTSPRGMQTSISPGRAPIKIGFDAATTVGRLSGRAIRGGRTSTPQITGLDCVLVALGSPSDHAYASHGSHSSVPVRIAYVREPLVHQTV